MHAYYLYFYVYFSFYLYWLFFRLNAIFIIIMHPIFINCEPYTHYQDTHNYYYYLHSIIYLNIVIITNIDHTFYTIMYVPILFIHAHHLYNHFHHIIYHLCSTLHVINLMIFIVLTMAVVDTNQEIVIINYYFLYNLHIKLVIISIFYYL